MVADLFLYALVTPSNGILLSGPAGVPPPKMGKSGGYTLLVHLPSGTLGALGAPAHTQRDGGGGGKDRG